MLAWPHVLGMITAVCVHVWGYVLLHPGCPAPALLSVRQQMAVMVVSLSVSRVFQIKFMAEVGRRKKCSSLILYGKTQRAMETYWEVQPKCWRKQLGRKKIARVRKISLSRQLHFINWKSLCIHCHVTENHTLHKAHTRLLCEMKTL